MLNFPSLVLLIINPFFQQVNSLNAGMGTNGSILVPELRSVSSSYKDPRLKPDPDYKFYISYDFYPLDNPLYHLPNHYGFDEALDKQRVYTPQLNHISMKLPPFPLMLNLKEAGKLDFCNSTTINKTECKTKFCECPHVLQIKENAVVELVIIDKGKVSEMFKIRQFCKLSIFFRFYI